MHAPFKRRIAVLTSVVAAAVLCYIVWVFASRYDQDRRIAQRQKTQEARRDAARYKLFAGRTDKGVRILHFYGSPAFIIRGEHAVICYGVENARRVRLDPPIDELSLALNRCISAEPKADTTYTLIAEGDDGTKVTEAFKIIVDPPTPEFVLFAKGPEEIDRGDRYAFCYGVKNASSVKLDPLGMRLPAIKKHCVMLPLGRSLDFTLTAYGERGMKAAERFGVKVK